MDEVSTCIRGREESKCAVPVETHLHRVGGFI